MRTLLVVLALLAMTVNAYGIDFLCASTEDWGTLYLVRGLSRAWYWPSGNDGKNWELMQDGKFQARKFMSENAGDWCLFLLKVKDGRIIIFGHECKVEMMLADSTVCQSDRIVAPDSPAEKRLWVVPSDLLLFENGHCPYGQTASHEYYPLYVRFPDGKCLGNGGDEKERKFRCKPVSIALKGAREVSGE